ncbi:MAG TPA: hypothetical protein ENN61_04535 [Bacteroidaceae bacterium]|nr:hypothetical protein [Bacteroidaceae bacterium]
MKFKFRYIIITLSLLAMIKTMSCEPENWMMIDCNECFSYKPDSANLIVYLTIDSDYGPVPLTFFKGKYEEGVIDWQDTATTTEFRLYSEIGQLYTVKAIYSTGDETIIAFDADRMTKYNAGEECGNPCYIVKGGVFDLRIKD